MAPLSAESTVHFARPAASRGLPWFLSLTAHGLLLVALVRYVGWPPRTTEVGLKSDSGIYSVSISSAGEEESRGTDPNESRLNGDPVEQLETLYDAGPAPEPQKNNRARHDVFVANEAFVEHSLFARRPFMDLEEILPVSGTSANSEEESEGTDEEGAESAAGSTNESPGNALRSGYARTSVFGATAEGRKFVYVFDRSGSMDGHGGAPLIAAKKELIESLKNLGSTQQFQIIFYNERPRVFSPTGTPGRLVFGTDQNKYLASKFIGGITADGATRHEEALDMALRMGPDAIFFLTDADEPRMTAKQLAQVAKKNQGSMIHTIEFGYGPQADADNFLVILARQNRGQHVYVDLSQFPKKRP